MREVIKQKTAQPTGGVPTMQQQQQPSGMVGPQGQMVTSNQFANTIQGGGAVTMANGKRRIACFSLRILLTLMFNL